MKSNAKFISGGGRSPSRTCLHSQNSLLTGKRAGNSIKSAHFVSFCKLTREQIQRLPAKFPTPQNRELFQRNREFWFRNRGIFPGQIRNYYSEVFRDMSGMCAKGTYARQQITRADRSHRERRRIRGSGSLQVGGRLLAPLRHYIVGEALTFVKGRHSGAFNCADVHKHVPEPSLGVMNPKPF
jgi:hypothetical protein